MARILSKALMILLTAILLLNMAANTIFAAVEVTLDKAYMEKIGQATYHLKYYREERDEYTYLVCSIVGYYDKDGNFNPSYCMNRDLAGAEEEEYYVKIDSLLDNDAVWRVIKNGYPYKSAKELGLSSKYDAYAVTKFAVYCILGEAELSYFKAEKDDEEAVAMLKALKNLVKIGKEGTEKQDDNPLTITKKGNFTEDGKYYSQEYMVNSTADFSTYKISKTSGLPESTYIGDENGKQKSSFKNGETFKVMIPKTSLTEDVNLSITVSAECKSYIILEGKTTVTKTQNYVLTAGEYATATAKTSLKISTDTGRVIVNKVDNDTKKPIEGVEFQLKNSKGKVIETKKTNEKGIIEFTGLYPGSYILVETKTKEEYVITDNNWEIEIEYNEIQEIDIENKHQTRSIKNI